MRRSSAGISSATKRRRTRPIWRFFSTALQKLAASFGPEKGPEGCRRIPALPGAARLKLHADRLDWPVDDALAA